MQIVSASINDFPIHSIASNIGLVLHQDLSGFEFPGVRFNPYQKPGEHGAVVPNEFYDGRTIVLNGRISGNTTDAYAQSRRALLAALRLQINSRNIAQPLLLKFTTLDGLNLQTYCKLAQPPQVPERSLNHGSFQIQLFSEDHRIYDQTTQIVTINLPSGGGVTYPVVYPVVYPPKVGGSTIITNAGTEDTFILATFFGHLTSPYIKNHTTGASFFVDYTIPSGEKMVCNMGFPTLSNIAKTMVLNDNQNAMQYFNYLNTWLSLAPGDNFIEIGSGISSDSGYVVINYKNAYIGH